MVRREVAAGRHLAASDVAAFRGVLITNDPRSSSRQDQVAPDHVAPDHVAPDQVAPDQVAPDQVAPDQVAPDQTPPDQVAPDQLAPDQVAPDQVPPDQLAPFQVPPDQVAPDGAPTPCVLVPSAGVNCCFGALRATFGARIASFGLILPEPSTVLGTSLKSMNSCWNTYLTWSLVNSGYRDSITATKPLTTAAACELPGPEEVRAVDASGRVHLVELGAGHPEAHDRAAGGEEVGLAVLVADRAPRAMKSCAPDESYISWAPTAIT